MKTKVEIGEYEIVIEEIDGMISVKAELEDEVIEEFSIEIEAQGGEDGENEIQGFDEFGGEEEDFDGGDDNGQEFGDDDDDGLEDLEEQGERSEDEDEDKTLESFQSFINSRRV